MKIYVINLASRPERLRHMEEQFARIALPFERIDAVDGRAMVAAGTAHPHLTPGAMGCFYSHLAAWKRIAESGEPWGTIFEDDLYFTAPLGPLLADTSWIPADADVVKLETALKPVYIGRSTIPLDDRVGLRLLRDRHMGGGAYVVSRRLALRLAEIDPMRAPVSLDAMIFDPRFQPLPKMKIYQTSPAIAVQDIIVADAPSVVFASDTDDDLDTRRRRIAEERYAGPIGRIRLATKGLRLWFKTSARLLRLMARHRTFDLVYETVPMLEETGKVGEIGSAEASDVSPAPRANGGRTAG